VQGQAAAVQTQASAPERLGKYPLLGVIGRGSMGVVYKTLDPQTHRPLALKTLRRDLLEDDGRGSFAARLRNEARAAEALAHPGIVATHEYGEDGAYAYIVMEYVEGRSLRECFEHGIVFSVTQAIDIVVQLLEALEHAHQRGVWHRDIKPSNILITRDGPVKVTDFGIARIASSGEEPEEEIMGTAGFVAPEMYSSDAFDGRVDVFAAGVVLYQLLTGAMPYTGTTAEVMLKVCCETPPVISVAAREPALEPFDAVVLRALARRPEDRFATPQAFRSAVLQAHARAKRGRARSRRRG
jgi:eukaryotic-like serine/threonine-protein kinase